MMPDLDARHALYVATGGGVLYAVMVLAATVVSGGTWSAIQSIDDPNWRAFFSNENGIFSISLAALLGIGLGLCALIVAAVRWLQDRWKTLTGQ